MRNLLASLIAIIILATPAFGQEKQGGMIPVTVGIVDCHSSDEAWDYVRGLPVEEPGSFYPLTLMRGYLVDTERLRLFLPEHTAIGQPEEYEVYDFVLSTDVLLGSDYQPVRSKASMVLEKKPSRWTITIREPLIRGVHLAVVRNRRTGLAVGQSFYVP